MNVPRRAATLLAWLATAVLLHASSEIVVAIRYLQAEGTSHSHLYLYKETGELLRQLTTDKSGQERNPIFAPDGETIVFTRETPAGTETWSVEPRGASLHKLPAPPDWYASAKASPYFTYPQDESSDTDQADGEFGKRRERFLAPDGSVEIVIRELKEDEEDQIDGKGHGKHYLLRNPKTGAAVEFGKIPGFEGVYDLLWENAQHSRRFLIDGALRVAFFGLHLDSTNGDTVYALDLNRRRLVRLSPNWAAPFPLQGGAAFLALTSVRYVPIPGSTKTANCSYVERWDAKLARVRYARAGAALNYGASMYCQGVKPQIVTIRDGE